MIHTPKPLPKQLLTNQGNSFYFIPPFDPFNCVLHRPGQYDLTGKFLAGENPRKSAFPKAEPIRDKSMLGPGPGSYQPLQSMGKQVLSTKTGGMIVGFPKADRPTLIPPGATDIGPGEYRPPPAACENQVDSRKPTCGKIKFGEGYKSGGNDRDKHNLREPAPG